MSMFLKPSDEEVMLEHFKRKIGQIVGALLSYLAERDSRKYGLLRHKTVSPVILKNVDWFRIVMKTITYEPLRKLFMELLDVLNTSLDLYAPLPEVVLSEGFGPSISGTEPRRYPTVGITKEEMQALMKMREELMKKHASKTVRKLLDYVYKKYPEDSIPEIEIIEENSSYP